MEKYYRPNFFDGVIYKKYGFLFEDKSEQSFYEEMQRIRQEIKSKMEELTLSYENQIQQLKSDVSERLVEVYTMKDKYYSLVE